MLKILSLRVSIALLASSTFFPAALSDQLSKTDIGKQQFIRCSSCHSFDPNDKGQFGPHLHGIIGRRAGAVEGYAYTELLLNKEFIWTEALMDEWLEKPQETVKDICLPFMGISNPDIRDALIEYMKDSVAF